MVPFRELFFKEAVVRFIVVRSIPSNMQLSKLAPLRSQPSSLNSLRSTPERFALPPVTEFFRVKDGFNPFFVGL